MQSSDGIQASHAAAEFALAVQGLGVRYGAMVALDDVSWGVEPGKLLGIIGPNGAGKSTCFDAATALVKRSGRVWIAGNEVTGMPAYRLAEFGLKRAFQHNAFFDDLSVLDNFVAVLGDRAHASFPSSVFNPLGALGKHREASSFAAKQLGRFGIPELYHRLSPKELPYGVQRMLSIALAFGDGARVLMLDEPAAGLGGEDMELLIRLLRDLKREGVALVIIEHHMDLIMAVADSITVLESGRQLASGTPQEIRDDPRVLEAYLGKAA